MRLYFKNELTDAGLRALMKRGGVDSAQVAEVVQKICDDVRVKGDDAVRLYTKMFDRLEPSSFSISAIAFEEAGRRTSPKLKEAIRVAADNITAFHSALLSPAVEVETLPGVVCRREWRAVERVGIYVPGGSAPLPSTVLMLGIPAKLAGCGEIALFSPMQKDGRINDAVLYAASVIGITEAYAVGGAQAVAAMAFGTQTIPRVQKIFGPGNAFVTAAKRYVSTATGGAAIDMLAGPSELLIIADRAAVPKLVAADLLSQAEHDPNSQVALLTADRSFAEETLAELPEQMIALNRAGAIMPALEKIFALVCETIDECIEFTNLYAPEHLTIVTENPSAVAERITNAGSVFLGSYSPVTAGDYASGTNHTLPTGGTAEWASGVTTDSFRKSITIQQLSKEGLRALAPVLTAFADTEGLPAHKRAVEVRFEE